jgi:hypothetical protein
VTILFWVVAFRMYIFCLYVSFCKLPRRGEILEVFYLNSHLILSGYSLKPRSSCCFQNLYFVCLFFFLQLPRRGGGNFGGTLPGLFFEGKKKPSKLGGIFVKENKCYFLKVKPPIRWGVFLQKKTSVIF